MVKLNQFQLKCCDVHIGFQKFTEHSYIVHFLLFLSQSKHKFKQMYINFLIPHEQNLIIMFSKMERNKNRRLRLNINAKYRQLYREKHLNKFKRVYIHFTTEYQKIRFFVGKIKQELVHTWLHL